MEGLSSLYIGTLLAKTYCTYVVVVELTVVFLTFQRNSKKFWDLFPSRSSPDDLDFEVGGLRLQTYLCLCKHNLTGGVYWSQAFV